MKIYKRLRYLVVVFTFSLLPCIQSAIQTPEKKLNEEHISASKKIVCYFGNWSVNSIGFDIENDIDPNICTHIIYAFVFFDEMGTILEKDTGNVFVI